MAEDSKALLKQAKAAVQEDGNFPLAVDLCQRVLQIEADNYTALVILGLAKVKLVNTKDAEQAYRKATVLKPQQQLAWQGLADLYEKFGDRFSAVGTSLISVYRSLAQCYADNKDKRIAVRVTQTILLFTLVPRPR